MQPIEWEVWERSPDDSGKMRYVRQRTGQEVFGELRDRLEGMGYLPEEYFLLGRDWRDGREIPRDAEFFCSATYYMDKVRQRPLDISDYDRAVLAIRDGALEEFEICYPKVPDQLDSLLVEAAGKAGMAGQKMTLALLDHAGIIQPEVYTAACKQAVDTGDMERVRELLEQAGDHLAEPSPALVGEVILHAYEAEYQNIARELIPQCTPEQIAAAPPPLLLQVVWGMDLTTAEELVKKGVQPGDYVVDVLHFLTGLHEEQEARELLEKGMPVEPDNYCALYVCINNQVPGIAKLLLDRGMDLDRYRAWAEKQPKEAGYAETMEEVSAYWAEIKSRDSPERPGPSMGGMCL